MPERILQRIAHGVDGASAFVDALGVRLFQLDLVMPKPDIALSILSTWRLQPGFRQGCQYNGFKDGCNLVGTVDASMPRSIGTARQQRHGLPPEDHGNDSPLAALGFDSYMDQQNNIVRKSYICIFMFWSTLDNDVKD